MFNNLGLVAGRFRIYRRPIPRRLPVSPIIEQGGSGSDIFYNNIVVTNSKPSPVPVTEVTTPTYTALSSDYFLCVDRAGTVVITLPTGILGTVYIVKDCSGNAFIHPITIQATGVQTVDGGVAVINTNYGSLTFVFNGVEWSIV